MWTATGFRALSLRSCPFLYLPAIMMIRPNFSPQVRRSYLPAQMVWIYHGFTYLPAHTATQSSISPAMTGHMPQIVTLLCPMICTTSADMLPYLMLWTRSWRYADTTATPTAQALSEQLSPRLKRTISAVRLNTI